MRKAARRHRRKGHAPNRPLGFVICPFGGWFDVYHEKIYAPAVKASGLQPRRADDVFMSSQIVNDIWQQIRKAKLVVAELTGKNPNVLYELGLAHALGKPSLLLTQSLDDVPFDLRGLRIILYDVRQPEWDDSLRGHMRQALREIIAAPSHAVLQPFLMDREVEEAPAVSAIERRLIELEQQINATRADSAAFRPSPFVNLFSPSPQGFTPPSLMFTSPSMLSSPSILPPSFPSSPLILSSSLSSPLTESWRTFPTASAPSSGGRPLGADVLIGHAGRKDIQKVNAEPVHNARLRQEPFAVRLHFDANRPTRSRFDFLH